MTSPRGSLWDVLYWGSGLGRDSEIIYDGLYEATKSCVFNACLITRKKVRNGQNVYGSNFMCMGVHYMYVKKKPIVLLIVILPHW